MTEPQSGSSASSGADVRAGSSGPLVVGLDVGTTAVKAVLVDERGAVLARRRVASARSTAPGGGIEHDAASAWWEAPRAVLAELVGLSLPSAIAVSAMMPSLGAVSASGEPLGAGLLYGDGRAAGHVGNGSEGADPTGSDEMIGLVRLAASQCPAASGYWPAQAVANAALGGEGVLDFASAMASGALFNGSTWDEGSCASAGIRAEQLPRVAMFGQRIGEVHLPAAPGAILGAGSVDGLCELLVAGVAREGDVLVALGSTLVVWLCVEGWPDCPPGLWRVPHLVAGKALVGGASNAGGMWVDWADRLFRETGPASLLPHEVPLWWPWARGERVPWHDRHLRVALAGADLSHGPPALKRAALEATGFVTRNIVDRASSTGTTPRRYIVSGGGTANPAWLKALSEALGAPVVPMAVAEGAALGAAFLARMSAGLEASIDDAGRWARHLAPVEPRESWVEPTAARYEAWRAGLPDRRT